ncbi:DASH complex subunit dad2 [Exophiala xenobiotica]|uniref:DASH complex subunit DAD2 n=1 Tax=Lithohypha guttulata TaxID=1690604 RepID=A0ABR0K5S6_9EURO|nr:DASH complex subunit dad2 [Lithohypha guttulata]KAK5324353.1 DASH complex subunit dad2 [Exophiala xenobiotica]
MSHRPSSIYGSQQSSALQSRINQKRAELENLRQLRDLSSQLATQMITLEEKLATLRDGTEAVSEVLKNWSNVLGVLQMVGGQLPKVTSAGGGEVEEVTLPGTLVRIPVEQGEEKGAG